jgi:hypothetical protein
LPGGVAWLDGSGWRGGVDEVAAGGVVRGLLGQGGACGGSGDEQADQGSEAGALAAVAGAAYDGEDAGGCGDADQGSPVGGWDLFFGPEGGDVAAGEDEALGRAVGVVGGAGDGVFGGSLEGAGCGVRAGLLEEGYGLAGLELFDAVPGWVGFGGELGGGGFGELLGLGLGDEGEGEEGDGGFHGGTCVVEFRSSAG